MPQRGIKRRPSRSPSKKATGHCSDAKAVKRNPGSCNEPVRGVESKQQQQNVYDSFDELVGHTLNVEDDIIGDDDEEEAWLDALEKGDLDDFGELKKEKDLSLMTARQKALKHGTSSPLKSFANITLLGDVAKISVMSEEAQKKRAEKNKKRKMQAVKRAEESQKNTIERLVKQQGVRGCKERQKKVANSAEGNVTPVMPKVSKEPMIKYHSKRNLITVSYPNGYTFPVRHLSQSAPKMKPACVVCGKPKRYNCSSTNVPVCSLDCYRFNLSGIQS